MNTGKHVVGGGLGTLRERDRARYEQAQRVRQARAAEAMRRMAESSRPTEERS